MATDGGIEKQEQHHRNQKKSFRKDRRLILSSALAWLRTEQLYLNDIVRAISQKKGRRFRSEWEEGNKTLLSSPSLKRKREGREGVT